MSHYRPRRVIENDLPYSEIDGLRPKTCPNKRRMPGLQYGATAPDFELPDGSGKPVRLSQYRGSNAVVLYFYPKDDTGVCTKQACGFRDDFARFQSAGAVILGVSDDSSESHRQFSSKYQLPFTLLSDTGGRVRKLYGVSRKFGVLPGRVTFVIDRDGVVRHVYSALFESEKHVQEALAALATPNSSL
jgi:peroxiredoxin Q/BCP